MSLFVSAQLLSEIAICKCFVETLLRHFLEICTIIPKSWSKQTFLFKKTDPPRPISMESPGGLKKGILAALGSYL